MFYFYFLIRLPSIFIVFIKKFVKVELDGQSTLVQKIFLKTMYMKSLQKVLGKYIIWKIICGPQKFCPNKFIFLIHFFIKFLKYSVIFKYRLICTYKLQTFVFFSLKLAYFSCSYLSKQWKPYHIRHSCYILVRINKAPIQGVFKSLWKCILWKNDT